MGESGSGKSTLLNILAMLDPADGRAGIPQWHGYLNHQEQGRLELPPGKTWLCLSRFQPARHLVCQGQYPLPSGPFSQTSQGNDEQGG